MKVYIVRYNDVDCSDILGVYSSLDKANEMARRHINDTHIAQDGHSYETQTRKDGTIDYFYYDRGIIYFTTIHEVQE